MISDLLESGGRYRPAEIAKKIGVAKKQVDEALVGWRRVEISLYGHVSLSKVKTEIAPRRNLMRGEYKIDNAMQIAMDRCKESRGDDFHAVVMTGGEEKYHEIGT